MIRTVGIASLVAAAVLSSAPSAQSAVRITEFMSEGQGDIDSGNGGRRQREFFELTNLGAAAVNVSTWSYNDNNVNDPHNWGPAIGSIAPGESIVFTQMTEEAFRSHWQLPAAVRIFSYLQLSNLGNADTINIYNSFTQDATTLVDSVTYTSDARGSGVSRNRPGDGGDGQYANGNWVISAIGDAYQSRLAPTPVTFPPTYTDPAVFADLANPGVYVNIPEPTAGVLGMAAAIGWARFRRRRQRV